MTNKDSTHLDKIPKELREKYNLQFSDNSWHKDYELDVEYALAQINKYDVIKKYAEECKVSLHDKDKLHSFNAYVLDRWNIAEDFMIVSNYSSQELSFLTRYGYNIVHFDRKARYDKVIPFVVLEFNKEKKEKKDD